MSARKKPRIVGIHKLRPELFHDSNINAIQKVWLEDVKKKKEKTYLPVKLNNCDVEIFQAPFPVCLVRNLVPKEMISAVLSEISFIKFHEKNNDLYQFHQTTDVANFKNLPAIKDLYSVICTDVFTWVEKTLVPSGLKHEIAATLSCYALGDRLLCHDDKCEDRHIAFVLYLTEDWTEQDGGNLDLLETDDRGDPQKTVVSIPALFNTLVLFEVSSTSYHQVTEVTSKTKKRLSLNGWFHKANLPLWSEGPPRPLETFPPSSSEFKLDEYMFVKYLSFKNQLDIKTMFVTNSEIQLDEFLQPCVFSQLGEEFNSDIPWNMVGPANIRHYEVADPSSLPPTLSYLWSLLQSRTWLRFLKNITGLDLVPLSNSDLTAWQKGIAPSCRVEIQRWLNGSYSLVHDRDPEFHTSALDVFIRFPMPYEDMPETDDDGPEAGHIIYIDKQSQDEECLLHLGYKMNSLGLIFREPGTLRFTKYLDSSSTPFYQIQCMYIPWAPPEDQPDLKHVDTDSETEPSDGADDDEVDEYETVTFEGVEGEELEVEDLEDELREDDSGEQEDVQDA